MRPRIVTTHPARTDVDPPAPLEPGPRPAGRLRAALAALAALAGVLRGGRR